MHKVLGREPKEGTTAPIFPTAGWIRGEDLTASTLPWGAVGSSAVIEAGPSLSVLLELATKAAKGAVVNEGSSSRGK